MDSLDGCFQSDATGSRLVTQVPELRVLMARVSSPLCYERAPVFLAADPGEVRQFDRACSLAAERDRAAHASPTQGEHAGGVLISGCLSLIDVSRIGCGVCHGGRVNDLGRRAGQTIANSTATRSPVDGHVCWQVGSRIGS